MSSTVTPDACDGRHRLCDAEYRPRPAAKTIRALQIDPNSSEAHAALGYVRHYEWRWADAEPAFLRAIDLNPGNALARLWYANPLI